MRALVCEEYGAPTRLVQRSLDDPVAAAGEVVVRIEAAGINFPDVLLIADRYQVSVPTPFIPGSEFAGFVESIGEGVGDVHVGDRVSGSTFVGAFAERIAVPARSLAKIPPELSFSDAAAFQVTYSTAYHALLTVGELQPGEWVVVLGAAGGVGSAAVDLARHLGARVVAAARGPERTQFCADLGADAVIDYGVESLKDRIKEVTHGGADLVIDPVGGAHSEQALRAIRPGGTFVTVGYASGVIPSIPLNLVLLKGITIRGLDVRSLGERKPEVAAGGLTALRGMVGDGLRPSVSRTISLADVPSVLTEVAARGATGKIVIDFSRGSL